MKNNYPHIILLLLIQIFWASKAYAKNMVWPINPIDSTKTKSAYQQQLALLQQNSDMGSSIFGAKKSNVPSPPASEDPEDFGGEEGTGAGRRLFPQLDKAIETNSFYHSLTTQKPEFNQAYLKAEFSANPKVDTLVAQAKKAFEAIKELGNFVDIITGDELLRLPVGLSKKDPTSGNSVELAITEVQFTPQYAEFKAWAKLIVPFKGSDGQKSRELYFGAEGVKLSHDGALIDGMRLVLLGNQPIAFNGDNWLLTLKGGIDLKTAAFNDQSFVEFDCEGLKSVGLEGDLRISRNVLLPIDDQGNYVCGNSAGNQFTEGNTIDNQCYVGASFNVKADGWNDLLMEISLPDFEVTGLKGWGFQLKNVVLDMSDLRGASNMTFPASYSQLYPSGDQNLWRGIYAEEVSVTLPKGIENTKTANRRVSFGAKQLLLDSQGVSGTFYGENVLKAGDGAAGKWGFTIDDVSISLLANTLTGGSIGGDIAVPITEEPMAYEGYIAPREYGLSVTLQSTYKTPVFLGEMQLARNSSVAIKVKEDKVYPYANLTGSLSIAGKIGQETYTSTQNNADDASGAFNFKGIVFKELELQTEPGQPTIQAKEFGFNGEMDVMKFPASVSNLQLVTPGNDQAGLSFDLTINLDESGSHATTSMDILGRLPTDAPIQKWEFEKVKVDGIEIDYEKSGVQLTGSLEIMDDDPTYGDGFSGELKANIKKLNFSANGKAMFGTKDFRYWFVDIWTDANESASNSKLLIDSFVGGLSNRMRKVSGNSNGFTPSSAIYEPDANTGLGLRAGVKITTQNAESFSGRAYLEMEFNTHGGLNRIGFMGEGAFMGKSDVNTQSLDDLEKTQQQVNNFINENTQTAQELTRYGNYMELSKQAIPKSQVAKEGKIGVYVGIEKDFVNDTFDGEFELYLNQTGIRGGGEDNLAGYAKMHTSPTDWYIYIGTPQRRISLVFSLKAVELEVGGYFMTGTQLPSQLDPHPQVVKILGSDILNGNRRENQLQAGKGFAFGLNFAYRKNYEFLIFYASLEAGAGFDVMHAYYPDAKCKGRSGPVGNDGWYSMGQVYAYLYGEFGVKVNLLFIKGKFQVAEAGVSAMLRGQFPNPVYLQGYVGMYYNILGGLVKGRLRLKVEMGEECELENIADAVGVPIISDVTPRDKSDDVSVFTAPQAVFNYATNQDFSVELDGGQRTFKLQLKNFKMTSQGNTISGELEWNDTNDAVTFKPEETLPSEKEVKVTVEVSFDEKIGGSYQTLIEDGKPVVEKREVVFTTDRAPDYIPWENIAFLYPVPEQRSFHPEEFKKGYVQLITGQNYLFEGGFEMRGEFVANGQGKRTDLSYSASQKQVVFDIPEMQTSTPYQLNLVVFPPGQDVPSDIVVEETEIAYGEEAGDTNWFDPSSGQQETTNTSATVVISNKKAANVTISNGAPKTILEYAFQTSVHLSFGDKVRSLNVTNNLTNFIYADVHSLSIKVADYEYLEKVEILGGKYTASKPLVYAEAVLKDRYYKNEIYPLLYEEYPLNGTIRVDRDEQVLGVPPIRSFYIGNEYLANLENNPSSAWVKNRVPFVYNLPYQYKADHVHFRNEILNRYANSAATQAMYDRYKYLLTAFPPLPLGNYKSKLVYRTPGGLYEKGYDIEYVND
ncbi:hypothetical protein [Allomuricauda sp. d1]|uniref:hypothetical protein n=1 Tax=Allomuricauda sp. d1 TaxID=3136725 RepID=UPI0031DB3BAD